MFFLLFLRSTFLHVLWKRMEMGWTDWNAKHLFSRAQLELRRRLVRYGAKGLFEKGKTEMQGFWLVIEKAEKRYAVFYTGFSESEKDMQSFIAMVWNGKRGDAAVWHVSRKSEKRDAAVYTGCWHRGKETCSSLYGCMRKCMRKRESLLRSDCSSKGACVVLHCNRLEAKAREMQRSSSVVGHWMENV